MMIDLAGVLAAAALLVTLVALEVRRAGPETGPPTHQRRGGRIVSTWAAAVMGALYLLLSLPRLLDLLT